jgi:hypothetical protein
MQIPTFLRKRSTALVSLAVAGASLSTVVHIDTSLVMQTYLLMLPFQLAALVGISIYLRYGKTKSADADL